MKYELGRILRWVLVVALLLLAIVCRVTAGALTESVWGRYAKERGLAPEAVGTQAQEDTPRARSVADMERLELFTVEEAEAWEEGNLFFLGQENTLYKILVLESGERVAARYSRDGYEYNTATGLWASPVGRWAPWELTETERASVEWKDLDLTTLDYYADMLGEERGYRPRRLSVVVPLAGQPDFDGSGGVSDPAGPSAAVAGAGEQPGAKRCGVLAGRHPRHMGAVHRPVQPRLSQPQTHSHPLWRLAPDARHPLAHPLYTAGELGDHQLCAAAGDGGVYEPGARLHQLQYPNRPGLAAVPFQLSAGHGHGVGMGQPGRAGAAEP